MASEIPAQGTLPVLNLTVPIHWDNHAILMFAIWFGIVPAAVMFLRFGKIAPRTYGIPRGTPKWAWPELCWTVHKVALYTAVGLALAGAALAMLLSGGFSGTLHGWFGLGTLALGALQVVSAWYRGSHGGRKDVSADPEDRATWSGDHFDMTPRRWWFEAYHKTAGYFTLFAAGGAVGTGLAQHWMPGIALALSVVTVGGLAAAVVLQGLGRHHDTYQSVYGSHPDHPFNRRRYRQMLEARGRKP